MLEITRIRNEKEAIIEGLKKRNIDATATLDQILTADQNWRSAKTDLESISAELNVLAKEIGDLFKQGKHDEANASKTKTSDFTKKEAREFLAGQNSRKSTQANINRKNPEANHFLKSRPLHALNPIQNNSQQLGDSGIRLERKRVMDAKKILANKNFTNKAGLRPNINS